MNSATYAAEQARAAYVASLPVPDQAAYYVGQAQGAMDTASREARQLEATGHFVLGLLVRETGSAGSLDAVHDMTAQEVSGLEEEIERLKEQIRMERRVFLDSQPTVSPAVGGLYFTRVPDNQVLIALLSTVGALLVGLTVGIYLGLFPIPYLEATTARDRLMIIAGLWSVTILMGYLGLYSFT
jgi:hypothetical protein